MTKQVLLFSGGLDSYVAAYLNPTCKLLYINSHAIFSSKEIARLPWVQQTLRHRGDREIIMDELDISHWERGDAIVPGRNLLFALAATRHGDDVLLATTVGDYSLFDKDPRFFVLASQLLNHIYGSHHFDKPDGDRHDPVGVRSPFVNRSKGEIVKDYLQAGGNPDILSKTISCYSMEHQHCGRCKPCLRKWIALQYNKCDYTPWASDPKGYDWDEIVRRIRQARSHGQSVRGDAEDMETMAVLGME